VTFDNDSADDRPVDNAQVLAPAQDQYFSGLTWSRCSSAALTTTLGRTWTRFVTAQRDTLLAPVFENRSTEGETSLRSDVAWRCRKSGSL
jgi:hypothetical protein